MYSFFAIPSYKVATPQKVRAKLELFGCRVTGLQALELQAFQDKCGTK